MVHDSILNSIKKQLGIIPDYTEFDPDIIMAINACFPALAQIGVGSTEGFMIEDASATWSDYLCDDRMLNNVKMYVYIKTKLLFDPPMSSIAAEAMNKAAAEYEWRIKTQVDLVYRLADNNDIDYIVRGSNDPLVVTIGFETRDIVNASAALYQNKVQVKKWGYSEMKLGEDVLILQLTDEDTTKLKAGFATLEMKWKTADGVINIGNDIKLRVLEHHDETRL